MHLISELTTDHRNVDALFRQFEQADAADHETLAHLRDLIVQQLSVHAQIEEQTLYPALREAAGEGAGEAQDDVLEALEEHHAVKTLLGELERTPPTHERFRAKMQVVIENVRHHIEEEEGDDGLFDLARRELKQPALEEMAERAAQLRAAGPTRPHPFLPHQPPFNVLIGVPVAVLDRTVSTVRKVVERSLLRKAS